MQQQQQPEQQLGQPTPQFDQQQPMQSGQQMQSMQGPAPQAQQMGQQMGQQMQQGQPVSGFYYTQNYLPENIRQSSAQLLGQCLADATDLLSQFRTAHWNVKGREFVGLHELFEDIAEDIEDDIDDIAERATALGATVSGTVRTSATASRVPELPPNAVEGIELVELLADRLATFDAILGDVIRSTQANGDIDTVDLLNDVSRRVSKHLWELEAHLQSPGPSTQMGSVQRQSM